MIQGHECVQEMINGIQGILVSLSNAVHVNAAAVVASEQDEERVIDQIKRYRLGINRAYQLLKEEIDHVVGQQNENEKEKGKGKAVEQELCKYRDELRMRSIELDVEIEAFAQKLRSLHNDLVIMTR
jgi:hypothetical protein